MTGDPDPFAAVRQAMSGTSVPFTRPPAEPKPEPPPEPSAPRGKLVPAGPMGEPPAGGDLVRAALRSAHRYR